MTDPSLDPILAYLREHSGRYSLEALRGQLLQAGYDLAAVDQAIAAYSTVGDDPPPPGLRVWPWALVLAAFNIVLTAYLGGPSNQQYWIVGVGGIGLVICFWELVLFLVLMVTRGTRPLGRVLLQALGIFAGLGIVVLGGLCAVS